MAAQRLPPPLAAGPAVWRRLTRERVCRAPPAAWPRPEHTAAAAAERLFWAQVALRPTYLTAKNAPMVQVGVWEGGREGGRVGGREGGREGGLCGRCGCAACRGWQDVV